jgi:hypothetical protein
MSKQEMAENMPPPVGWQSLDDLEHGKVKVVRILLHLTESVGAVTIGMLCVL